MICFYILWTDLGRGKGRSGCGEGALRLPSVGYLSSVGLA